MKQLHFAPMAESDLDGIWDYSCDRWGMDQADSYIDAILDMCGALAAGTRKGQPSDIRPACLKAASGSHMIYFLDRTDRIEIVRILHVRQDVERNL